jgi:hypothetical protein
MKASKLDREFDPGEDVSRYLDMSRARRPGLERRQVNVDFPVWMIDSLDREAARLGVRRQSLVKIWIAERLERLRTGAELATPGSVLDHSDVCVEHGDESALTEPART